MSSILKREANWHAATFISIFAVAFAAAVVAPMHLNLAVWLMIAIAALFGLGLYAVVAEGRIARVVRVGTVSLSACVALSGVLSRPDVGPQTHNFGWGLLVAIGIITSAILYFISKMEPV